ncbi:uncharacterized protein LOC107465760 [Arachis duranensis]|uniref:Uncharacterized protein LOC107465760 n=1 Tax=Arachis duranensis TaxID=130453 RepID=A0A6P4C1U8_ARADU|nr:uncharacterized protein LOC107465760 [Arachis duranensis]
MLDIFYNYLSEASKMSLDHSAGGSLYFKKMPEEAQELIDMVANNQYMYTSERNPVNNGIAQKRGVLEVGQLSKKIPEIPSNTLSSNTEVNSREECKALTVEVMTEPKEEPAIEELKEIRAHEETNNVPLHASLLGEEPKEYTSSDEDEASKEEQIARFLAILRKLKANFSHTEVVEEEDEPVVLAKECSALVQKKLPQKLPDSGSFLIPCTIGTITFEKALYDLGSSINLMPLSVMKRLEILEVQHAKISLEMAEKSLKRAYNMVEDVLVMVEDLYIPANFVVLDTGGDDQKEIIANLKQESKIT